MNRNDIIEGLDAAIDGLKKLEARARDLQNKNLADVAASALGRVKQLMEHPDLALVSDDEHDADTHASKADHGRTFIDQAVDPAARQQPFVLDKAPGALGGDGDYTFPAAGVNDPGVYD